MNGGDGLSKMTKLFRFRSIILGIAIIWGALLAVGFISNHSLAEMIISTLSVFFFSWLYVIIGEVDCLSK